MGFGSGFGQGFGEGFARDDTELVEVPDVVGEAQADAVTAIEGAGLVVSITTRYDDSVEAGDVIGQEPSPGSNVESGSTVIIIVSLGVEPASNNKGAGRPRRRRYLVEIDGQDFEVSSPEEAAELLERARKVAETVVEKARATPVRVGRGLQRPRITTKAPELKQVVAQARRDIGSLYDSLARDMEIAALMARTMEDEEEEALLRFLI